MKNTTLASANSHVTMRMKFRHSRKRGDILRMYHEVTNRFNVISAEKRRKKGNSECWEKNTVHMHTLWNEEILLVDRSQHTIQVGKIWLFWFITSYLAHQRAAMGNFFLKCSLLVINLEICNELVFGISLALPTHCCSKGMESSSEVVSWDFQDVTKCSEWNDAIPAENNQL